jgi:hypothetical protein
MLTARISHLSAAALLGCLGFSATACSSGAGTTANPGTTRAASARATTPPNPSALSPVAQAIAAYDAMWSEVAEASYTADYQAPYLTDHLAGQALTTITENMAVEQYQGVVARGSPVLHPVVTTATPTSVHLSDCLDDRGWLQYNAATGALLNSVPGGFSATTATVTDENGIWKVTQLNTGNEGTCHLSQ